MCDVVEYILKRAQESLDTPEDAEQILCPIISPYDDPMKELLETGVFFPNHPMCAQVTPVAAPTPKEGSCTKDYKSSGKLGAGVVLFWCIKHRECIGFQVLQSAESCQSIYNVISTRLKKQPDILIYDNACNLYEVLDSIINV
jgi:hypothetical protein